MRKPAIDVESTATAVAYLVKTLKRKDFHSIFKALYLADLAHLERYGRMITWEDYAALQFGPVPMNTFKIMGNLVGESFHGTNERLEADLRKHLDVKSRLNVDLAEDPDLDQLSDSDIECLNEAAATIDRGEFGTNTDLTHDSAWTAAWGRRHKSLMRFDEIVEQLPDADLLRGYLAETLGTSAG